MHTIPGQRNPDNYLTNRRAHPIFRLGKRWEEEKQCPEYVQTKRDAALTVIYDTHGKNLVLSSGPGSRQALRLPQMRYLVEAITRYRASRIHAGNLCPIHATQRYLGRWSRM
jgi:hypothetical protein